MNVIHFFSTAPALFLPAHLTAATGGGESFRVYWKLVLLAAENSDKAANLMSEIPCWLEERIPV